MSPEDSVDIPLTDAEFDAFAGEAFLLLDAEEADSSGGDRSS